MGFENFNFLRAKSKISGLRNDMNKRTFYKERKINNRCFDFLSKQNIIVFLDINVPWWAYKFPPR